MDKIESLSDSIRRKVAEKKAEVQKSFTECDTTEVSASQMQLRRSGAVVQLSVWANPLLPICITLAVAVLVLSVLLVTTRILH